MIGNRQDVFRLIVSGLLVLLSAAVHAQSVTGFVLVDATSNADIGALVDGQTLNLPDLPASAFSVRAETSPAAVGSVVFDFNGQSGFRTENAAPYALGGDSGGDYAAVPLPAGSYTLTATPYAGANGQGAAGPALSIAFTVTDPASTLPQVDAGVDQALVLPAAATSLQATAGDDGQIVDVSWQQTSGPALATLEGAMTASLAVSNLVAGRYTFEVTVTDDDGNMATDAVDVLVIDDSGGSGVVSGELKQWHRVAIDFPGPPSSETASPNPFLDHRLDVTFVHGGSGKQYRVPGFFAADGNAADTGASAGNTWRVYFAPDETGQWTYAASFRSGAGVAVAADPLAGSPAGFFDGDSGSFTVVPSDKSGRDFRAHGRLQYDGTRYLRFAGSGGYFLKQGADAPENLLAYADFDGPFAADGNRDNLIKTWAPHVGDWQSGDPEWQSGKGRGLIGALNYLANEGQNAVSFLTMNIGGDDRNVFPYLDYGERLRVDVSRLAQWELVFSHAQALGLFLHFKTQETENEMLLDSGDTGTERRLYYRELIARFGHHLALNWNLGEENGALGAVNQSTAQRQAMAQFFAVNDPYQHLRVIHNGRNPNDLLGGASALTGFSLQTDRSDFGNVHRRVLEWIDKSVNAGKPWVVACDEPGDAQAALRPDSDPGNAQVDGRKNALWGTLMAGGAGNEWYFGYGYPNSDLTLQDFRSRDAWWDVTRAALAFFEDNAVPFPAMHSADALSSAADSYVFREAGAVYAVYLKDGGETMLDLTEASGQFVVEWYDPRNGGALQPGTVATVVAGAPVSLGLPPAPVGEDWTALVRLDSDVDQVPDATDAFPDNPAETLDSDGDGMGDNFETAFGLDPDDPGDAVLDPDRDGMTNLEEFLAGTNPRDALFAVPLIPGAVAALLGAVLAFIALASGQGAGGLRDGGRVEYHGASAATLPLIRHQTINAPLPANGAPAFNARSRRRLINIAAIGVSSLFRQPGRHGEHHCIEEGY